MITKGLSYFVWRCQFRVQCLRIVTANQFCSRNSELQPDTLLNRFLHFLRSHDQYRDKMVTPSLPVFDATFYRELSVADDEKMSFIVQQYELPDFIFQVNVLKRNGYVHGVDRILNCAENICSQALKNMDKTEAMKCFDALLYVHGADMTDFKYSWIFVAQAKEWVERKICSLRELVLIMFYAGLLKKSFGAPFVVKKCLQEIVRNAYYNDLSIDELCIVASSAFKASVDIKSQNFLDFLYQIIDAKLPCIMSDTGYFVTLIKVLRFSKYYNFDVMDKIAENLKSSPLILEQMYFISKVHLLAFYADALYIDDDFFELIKDKCVQDLTLFEITSFAPTYYLIIRIKDISLFLWAVSYLGYHLSENTCKAVCKILEKKVSTKEHLRRPTDIVSCLLSLWILKSMETSLFQSVVSEVFMKKIKEMDRHRIKWRLSLLLQCISIEKPEILREHHAKWDVVNVMKPEAMERDLRERRTLNKVYTCVKCLSSLLNLHVTCDFCIPNLNILGITVISNEGDKLAIEVLDASVCRRGSLKPHGLMNLKLRLLRAEKRKILLVTEDQFENSNESTDMYVFLEDKLRETFYPDYIAGDFLEKGLK